MNVESSIMYNELVNNII